MNEENNSRKVFLSVLGVAILIVAVVGISYAAFSFTNTGEENTITTGTITVSYTEPEAGFTLADELPMSSTVGKTRTVQSASSTASAVFDFTVHTKATGKVAIPYEINFVKTYTAAIEGVEVLPDANVRMYLEKGTSATNYAPAWTDTYPKTADNNTKLVSALTATGNASTIRTGSYKLYETTDDYTAAAGETTTYYRLRMWVDEETDMNALTNADGYKFAIKVNVDSRVAPLS